MLNDKSHAMSESNFMEPVHIMPACGLRKPGEIMDKASKRMSRE